MNYNRFGNNGWVKYQQEHILIFAKESPLNVNKFRVGVSLRNALHLPERCTSILSTKKRSRRALPPPHCPFCLFLFFAVGKEEKRIGCKNKKITWHNSRREWLLSIRDCISQILIRQLSLARTFALGVVQAKEREREEEKVGGGGRVKRRETKSV